MPPECRGYPVAPPGKGSARPRIARASLRAWNLLYTACRSGTRRATRPALRGREAKYLMRHPPLSFQRRHRGAGHVERVDDREQGVNIRSDAGRAMVAIGLVSGLIAGCRQQETAAAPPPPPEVYVAEVTQ